jgi:CDP-paratose 2-epimerase
MSARDLLRAYDGDAAGLTGVRETPARAQPVALRDRLGLCQWFHYEDRARVQLARELLHELGVRHLRMDISWADYHRPGGRRWYAWLFEALEGIELLACVWHTPPSIARNGKSNGAPLETGMFADFLAEAIELYGRHFEAVELWNEPNNRIKWDPGCDRDWRLFAEMIGEGAARIARHGKTLVLGGMSPVDGGWLDTLRRHVPGVFDHIDAIGVHAFPGQWNEPDAVWGGWPGVFDHLRRHVGGRPIWVTEVGRSAPARGDERGVVRRLRDLVRHAHHAERVYWYSLLDLPQSYDELEFAVCGYREPLEHSLGLVAEDGRRKPAFEAFRRLLQD